MTLCNRYVLSHVFLCPVIILYYNFCQFLLCTSVITSFSVLIHDFE